LIASLVPTDDLEIAVTVEITDGGRRDDAAPLPSASTLGS